MMHFLKCIVRRRMEEKRMFVKLFSFSSKQTRFLRRCRKGKYTKKRRWRKCRVFMLRWVHHYFTKFACGMLSSLTRWMSLSLDDSRWSLPEESHIADSLLYSGRSSASLGITTFEIDGTEDAHRAEKTGDSGAWCEVIETSYGDSSPILYFCASRRVARLWNIRSSVQSFTPPPRLSNAPLPPGWRSTTEVMS